MMAKPLGALLLLLVSLATPTAGASGVRVVVLGDLSRVQLVRSLALHWNTRPGGNPTVLEVADPRGDVAFLVPAEKASIFDVASAALRADSALVAMDATKGPTPVFREHVILARQASVPAVGILITNVEGLAREKDAKGLLELEEREAREVLKLYGPKVDRAPVFQDPVEAAEALRASPVRRQGPPAAPPAVAEFDAAVYLLSSQESGASRAIAPGGDLSIWIDGHARSGKAVAHSPLSPGDNATLGVRLGRPTPARKGARFFLEREGHLVGVGTVVSIAPMMPSTKEDSP